VSTDILADTDDASLLIRQYY